MHARSVGSLIQLAGAIAPARRFPATPKKPQIFVNLQRREERERRESERRENDNVYLGYLRIPGEIRQEKKKKKKRKKKKEKGMPRRHYAYYANNNIFDARRMQYRILDDSVAQTERKMKF